MPKSDHRRRRQGRRQYRRLFLEQVEDRRVLAATITVDSTDDSDLRDGALTLREAIEVSNGALAINLLSSAESLQVNGVPDGVKPNTIGFNIAGSVPGTVQTISSTSTLPDITAPVTIDGYTQPGAAANTNAIDDPNPTKRGFNGKLLIELSGMNGVADGLSLSAAGSTIRGLVIDDFGSNGIIVNGDNNTIEGNLIGVDPGGTQRLGNGTGIFISSANNHIGGTTPDARNVISGSFTFHGVELQGTGATGNVIQGNFIGTDASGTAAVPNSESGIFLTGASNNAIGGELPGARNVISGNGPPMNGDGISLFFGSNGNAIQGNYIGVDVTGAQPLGNGNSGINISDSSGNVIGGATAGEGNTIAFNGSSGVEVSTSLLGSRGNPILSNSIFSNAGLGIDLDPQGIANPNDTGDLDSGPNNLQNFPEISPAPQLNGGSLTVTYRVPSVPPNSTYPLRIEFFKADSSGQGQKLLGFDAYDPGTAGAPKTVTIPIQPGVALVAGDKIVATATDSNQAGGNTSEFSATALVATSNSNPSLSTIGSNDQITVNEATVPLNVATPVDFNLNASDLDSSQTLTFSLVIDTGGTLPNGIPYDPADPTQTSLLQISIPSQTPTPGQPPNNSSTAAGTLEIKAGPNAAMGNPTQNWILGIQVSDGAGGATERRVILTVVQTNSPPQITSDGGGDTAALNVPENSTAVTTVQATDLDAGQSLSYSIAGGADAGAFLIDPASGSLAFADPPNFEQPTDVGGDNSYAVIVQVNDGSLTDAQTISVTVTNVNEPPVITSNGGLDQANVSIPENTTAVTDVNAVDPDAGTTLSYSINGGSDAALFSINPTTGVLAFLTPPNFESPTDSNADNVYQVTVQASDGSLTTGQQLLVGVTDVNEPPVITSDGGGPTASLTVSENSTTVTTVAASDPDLSTIPVYSIGGGADATKFSINSSSGVLTFVSAPDFENPTDAGGNNVYDVTVVASDGNLTDTQALAVTVTDAVEPADLQITNTDGATTATPGSSLTYAIVVTNSGPTPVNGAIVHDDFPSGFAISAVAATGAGGASGFSNSTTNNQLNQMVILPVGASITYAVTGSVSASATGTLSNTATVTAPATISDSNPSNNTATDADTISASADLKVTQSASPDPVKAGTNLAYTITLNSTGPSDAQNVSLTDDVPANTTFVSFAAPAGWTNALPAPGASGTVKSSLSPLSVAKGPQVFTLVVNVNATAPGGSAISNTALVSTATNDPDLTNNKAIQTTAVTAQTGSGGIVNDHYVTNEDQTLAVTFSPPGVLANDSSVPPGQPLFATLVTGPAHGKVQLKPDGTFVYTPAPDFFGTDQFLYGASTSVASKGIFAATWNFNASAGEWGKLYQIAPGTTSAALIGKLQPPPGVKELSQPMGLAFTPQGKLYLLTGGYLMDVNPQTAALTVIGRKSPVTVNEGDLVYNPADSLLYASGAAKDSLVRIDPATGVRTVIGPMGASARDVSALAFGADGTLYGVALRDASPDLFVKIDTQTGHATAIGPTGTNETIRVLAGMAFDPATSRLYFTLGSTAYLIDPLTGHATSIGTIQAVNNGQPIGYISGLALEGPDLAIGTVSIDVLPINDAPSFVAGINQTVGSDFGPQTIPLWATGISAGAANESQQHLNFVLNVNQPDLFSVEPTVDASGTLRYTPLPGAVGTASITIALHDDGGTANGGVDTSAQQTFTITVVPPPGPTGVFLVAGTLRINGGATADAASVTQSGNRLVVNGTIGGAHVSQSFFKGQVQRIEAYLGDGNDSLTIGSTVRTPAFVDGGAGNDKIRAGGGPSVLLGGDGNDALTGGTNRDVLIGGSGADTLSGGGNSDLLIAGTTAFDQNKAALLAIQAEWSSGRSLNQRMADLRSGAGPFLQPLGVKLVQNQTVLNDTEVDTLFGGADLDWFFADLAKDKLKDRLSSEKVG